MGWHRQRRSSALNCARACCTFRNRTGGIGIFRTGMRIENMLAGEWNRPLDIKPHRALPGAQERDPVPAPGR